MIVINPNNNYSVTECSRVHAAKMVGLTANTLWRWECKKFYRFKKTYSGFIVVFDSIERIKQIKGFALNK